MSTSETVATEVPVPEPDLTPDQMIARAVEMKPALRAEQDDSEQRGYCSEETHRQFLRNGFYRLVQPRRFGGYEFDLKTFWKVAIEIATGDPGVGWYLALASHHALVVGAMLSERAQREIFGPEGEYRGPHRPAPMGKAKRVEGGWVIDGTWDYCSGVPYATHAMVDAMTTPDGGGDPVNTLFVVPMDQVKMLHDWGGGSLLGMQSSGSNAIEIHDAFVPDHWTTDWGGMHVPGPRPGLDMYRNPMYAGMFRSVYHAGLVCAITGAARAAIDELEEILTTKKTFKPPQIPRHTHPDHQRVFGLANAYANSAEGLIMRVADLYTEYGQRWLDGGEPFSGEEDIALYQMLQQAGQLAVRAIEECFANASSSAAKRGQRMLRYYRDASMYKGHISAQYMTTAVEYAAVHFGLQETRP